MSRFEPDGGRLVPLAMLLFGACSYAMTFSLNRIAITEGIPVVPFVFWQGVGAGTVALIAGLVVGQRPRLTGAYLRFYFLFGFIGIVLPYTLLALAAPRVPAGAVALTLTLSPILTYAFSILFRLDRVRLLRVTGILLGLAGNPGDADPGDEPAGPRHGAVAVVSLRLTGLLRLRQRCSGVPPPGWQPANTADLRHRLREHHLDGASHGRRRQLVGCSTAP